MTSSPWARCNQPRALPLARHPAVANSRALRLARPSPHALPIRPLFDVSRVTSRPLLIPQVVQFTNGNNDHLTLAFALTARFAATVLASVVWLAGAEIFPTSVRSFALGVGASAGRVGCIVFPLLVDWGFSAGYATASVLVLICGALTLLLQDMKGRDLSDSKPTGPEQPVPFKG